MRVIDLLNEIANGEISENISLHSKGITYSNIDEYFEVNYVRRDILNDEVEIIEEDKKIEKLPITYLKDDDRNDIITKINEIIDVVNEMREE